MAFGSGSSGGNTAAMGDINVTPLVDVMLVLLIIFMVTTPLLSHAIPIDLPQRTLVEIERIDPPDPIRLRIDAEGGLTWNNAPLSHAAMVASLQVEASRDPQPALELETSGDADYAVLAGVLAAAKRNGMQRVGFVDVR